MAKELFSSCIVEYDELGEIVGVYELKTLKVSQIEALKKQAKENLARKQDEENAKRQLAKANEQIALEKDYRRALVLAKQQFNELVECGKSETTEQFETAYDNFIYGGELDLSVAPIDFKVILERVR